MVREFAYHTVQRADGGENNLYINIYFKIIKMYLPDLLLVPVALPLHMQACTHQLSFFTSLIIIIIILLLIKILPIYASTIPDSVRQLRMCGTNYNKLKYCMFTVYCAITIILLY